MKRKLRDADTRNLVFDGIERAREYGKRGAAMQNAKNAVYVYIEGKPYTYRQIAERIERSESRARDKVSALRKAGKPITWENLSP